MLCAPLLSKAGQGEHEWRSRTNSHQSPCEGTPRRDGSGGTCGFFQRRFLQPPSSCRPVSAASGIQTPVLGSGGRAGGFGGWAGRWPGPGLDGQVGRGKAQKDHPSGDGHHWPRVRVSPDYLFVLIEKLSV